ncbi:diguanylate cyclase (GGDEF)-like protein [Salinibacterium sp. CAN_S4]|uniref:diguanylate cyclase n=1 Tax=Salinibacterium sp. CAN_S4 TaxID=2787727 RepID=UPI0018EF80CB
MTADGLPLRDERTAPPRITPAAIQSWGIFIAVDPGTMVVTHVSDNTTRLAGVEPSGFLGRSLADIVGGAAVDRVREVIAGTRSTPTEAVVNGTRFDAISHSSGDSLFVELEPYIDSDERAHFLIRDAMRSMATAQTTSELWARAASGMRAITGYDRVDISYYHPDGHGEVVAAAQAEDLESHLGIHFSAAYIADEPSRVYLTKQSRMVINSQESVSLLSADTSADAVDLDLAAAVLSAPSPRDSELLRGVGYGSTFFIAVVRNGALLGVINCGNRSERPLHYTLRDALELLANQLALQFGAMQEIQMMKQRDSVRQIRAILVAQVAAGEDIVDSLLLRDITLLDFIPADGAAINLGGRLGTIGRVPAEDVIRRIPAAVADLGGGTDFSSDAVPIALPTLARELPGVTGLLIRRLGNSGDFIAWFRGESTHLPEWIQDPATDDETSAAPGTEPVRTSPPAISGASAHWAEVEAEASELVRELSSVLVARSTAELAEMALRDPLTGLLNRRALVDALARRLSADYSGPGLAVIFVDIDDFKAINDAHGHAAGDTALIHVARSLRSAARESDIVARLGGDEFVVVFNAVDELGAYQIATRILNAVRASPIDGGWPVTASVGVALAVPGQTASQLLSAADAAMFRAKLAGRDRTSR